MGQLVRLVNHSFIHFFIHDIEDSWDSSNQFKDDYPYSFADDYFEADKGSLLVNKEPKALSAIPVCLQIRKEVIHDCPTQGWTVNVCNIPTFEAKCILYIRHLLSTHK